MTEGHSAERGVRIAGNQQLPLDDPAAAWVVHRGGFIVFSLPMRGTVPGGPRRPLVTVGEGSAMFGSAPGAAGTTLLAVALRDSEIFASPLDETVSTPGGKMDDLRQLAFDWMHRLVDAIGDDSLGVPELSPEPLTLYRELESFHARLRLALASLDRRELEERARLLADKQQQRAETIGQALAALAGAAQPALEMPVRTDGPPLLAAFRAAGRVLGIEVVEPPRAGAELDAKQYARALSAASRCRVRLVILPDGWWKSDCGPLVGFRKGGQPVALIMSAPGRYELVDPSSMARMPVDRAVAAGLVPQAFMLYRPFAERAVFAVDLIRFGFRGQSRAVRVIVAAVLLATVLGMLTPVLTGALIDTVVPDANRGLLVQLAAALATAAFGKALFDLAQGYSIVRLESSSSHDTQAAVWDRLLAMRPAFFRKFTTGDLASRGLSISMIHRQLSGATMRSLIGGAASLLNLFLLFYYSGRLALIALTAGAAAALLTFALGRQSMRRLAPLQALEGNIFGFTVQLIHGVAKLRVSASESAAFARWARKFVEQQKLRLGVQRIEDALGVFNEFMPVFASALLFWFASSQVLGSEGAAEALTTGVFLAFNAAFGTFLGAATSLSNTIVDTLANLALFERARPILEGEPEVDSRKADPGTLAGRVAVDHVTFRYRSDGPMILEDVTLRTEPGEFVAIVGPSGSGKSTLLRLLLGFERPESGTVYFDGQDLNGLNVNALRRQLGVVLQNSSILAGSVFENISAGAALNFEDAWAAARDAGLEDDLAPLPMGMHTYVSEGGTNLSGGQRQRLLIARALARLPRVVFFDEATSALDNRTQDIVSRSLERLNVTRIVIAHRLSTVQRADRIYVIQGGRVVQEGTFAALAVQRDGLFARMIARQML